MSIPVFLPMCLDRPYLFSGVIKKFPYECHMEENDCCGGDYTSDAVLICRYMCVVHTWWPPVPAGAKQPRETQGSRLCLLTAWR